MSTASLLRWIALVAGAELAVRGHLANHAGTCHAGAALFAIAFAAIAWPTRARRMGAIAAAALLAIAAIDAVLTAVAGPSQPAATSLRERAERDPRAAGATASPPAAPAPGSHAILVFDGRERDAQPPFWPQVLGALLREQLRCEQPLAVVEAPSHDAPLGDPAALADALARVRPALVLVLAANELLDHVIAELPALDFPATAIGPRGSAIGRAIEVALAQWRAERRWRRTLGAEIALDPRASRVVARYRELVLAARRADADVALLIPALAIDPQARGDLLRAAEAEAPHLRGWLLASRAHARSLRALAGSYGIPAIDTRPGLEGTGSEAFHDLGRLSIAGRARLAEGVAAALAERLARTPPGCRPARNRATGR